MLTRIAENPAEPTNAQLALTVDLVNRKPMWQYGYGWYDQASEPQTTFRLLGHWTGTQWQAGKELPDPQLGYTLLRATGGHPGSGRNAVIRRWTSPADGVVTITGALSHPSENGDGVRGRIVSSRAGKLHGQWVAYHDTTETMVEGFPISAGDTVDFITDCREGTNTDSYDWKNKIVLRQDDGTEQTIVSDKCFNGHMDSYANLAGQIIRAWELAYGRQPADQELVIAAEFLQRQLSLLESSPEYLIEGRTAVQQAMSTLCHSLFASNEFLYVE